MEAKTPGSDEPTLNGWQPSDLLDSGRFPAGTMVADRYRVVALAGRGGMGEVYKAEDLKLGQLVALKFLPDSLSHDGAALARFHREVRTARQITHPNVCRVHDIGEAQGAVNGLPFLSMEFVDGENLAALLRRIGHLPAEKGVQIARQICSGLSAAHQRGVLHRDLKPANIMLDGDGRSRIMDFGLAGFASESRPAAENLVGTPAYMAPELLKGKPASVQSDIYALGLVLYELFTGKRLFEGRTIEELIRQQDRMTPTPSSQLRGMDPNVERVIIRCLAKHPDARPRSALEVAASLPVGDPLAAALAAGETPSPEMVAAAGEKTGFRPATAIACLAAIVTCLWAWALGFGLASCVFGGVFMSLLYMACEPYVRRLWPHVLITWSRVLDGKFRDPLVGRDVLIGILFAIASRLLHAVSVLWTTGIGGAQQLNILIESRQVIATVLFTLTQGLTNALGLFFIAFIVRAILRSQVVAAGVYMLLVVITGAWFSPGGVISMPTLSHLVFAGLGLIALMRFGLIALVSLWTVRILLMSLPVTTNLSVWYAGRSMFVLAILIAVAAYACRISFANQRVFDRTLLED